MLKIKGLAAEEELDGFIDQGTEFQGELRFRNVFRIDGRLRGRIVSENTLIIGERGEVEAEIDCGTVSIKGSAKGQIHGRQKIELLTGSRVTGTLSTPVLTVEEGSLFKGDCDMGPGAGEGAGEPAPRQGDGPKS